MTYLMMFTVGFILGVATIIAASYIYSRRVAARLQKQYGLLEQELDSILSKVEERVKAQKRLNKVKDITHKQLELYARADGPQKNALDGKYKNSLIREINDLEEEKRKIISSILEDNLDPEISVLDGSNQIKTMKLSEYMAYIDTVKSRPNNINDKKHKFTLHYGGKWKNNDDNNNNNPPTP